MPSRFSAQVIQVWIALKWTSGTEEKIRSLILNMLRLRCLLDIQAEFSSRLLDLRAWNSEERCRPEDKELKSSAYRWYREPWN